MNFDYKCKVNLFNFMKCLKFRKYRFYQVNFVIEKSYFIQVFIIKGKF